MKGYKKYQKASVEKMDSIKLTIWMYQRCLLNMKWIKENREKAEERELEEKFENTELIINELQLSLNWDQNVSAEVKNHVNLLDSKYRALLRKVLFIKESYSQQINQELIEEFQELLDAYRKINGDNNE